MVNKFKYYAALFYGEARKSMAFAHIQVGRRGKVVVD
jgi:hypothetical protein